MYESIFFFLFLRAFSLLFYSFFRSKEGFAEKVFLGVDFCRAERVESYQVTSTFPTGWKSVVAYTLNQGTVTGIDTTLQNAQRQPISSSTMNVRGHILTETDSRKQVPEKLLLQRPSTVNGAMTRWGK